MTHSMETLLRETKDLRQQLRDKDMKIGNLESDLKKINTCPVMRFDETSNNMLARGGTLANERPEQLLPASHSPMRHKSPPQMRGTYDQPATYDFKMKIDL